MPDPMSEQLPNLPGLGNLNPIAQIAKVLAQAQAARQAGQSKASPAITPSVVGPQPNLPRPPGPILPGVSGGMTGAGGSPLPGAGGTGPTDYPSPAQQAPPPVQGGQEYHSKSARNSAIVANASNAIIQSVTEVKQKQFEQRRQAAAAIMSQYIAMKQSDDPNIVKQADAILQDKKALKILEKAQKDPTSPEYQGITMAQKQAAQYIQGQQEQQAKLEQIKAQAAAAQAEAAKAKAATPQTPDERAVAMGTKTSADVAAQNASRERVAEIEAGRMTRGQPILDEKTKGWVVPWYDHNGKLDHYTPLEGGPASALPTKKESVTTIDSQGRTVTDTTTSKVSGRADSAAKTDGIKATPSGTPMGQASQFQKRVMLDNAAWNWATTGQAPPSTAFKNAVYARMMQYGMTPGMKPTADMLRRASMANQIIQPEAGQTQSLIDRTIAAIDANRAELDTIGKRTVNSIDQFAKVLPPELSAIASNLQSIYTVAAGLHGFRSIRAPEEFKNTFGSISMRPDSLENDLKELKIFAQTVAATQTKGMGGNTGTMNTPGAGAGVKGTGTKDDPIVVKPSDISQ